MHRIFSAAVVLFTVVLSSAVSFAEKTGDVSPQKIGKDFYRTQYRGGFVMPQPIIAPRQEYSTGGGHIPAAPAVPDRAEQLKFAPPIVLPGETVIFPGRGTVISDRIIDEGIDERIDKKPAAKSIEKIVGGGIDEDSLERPLSGIDLPKKTDSLRRQTGEKPWTSSAAGSEPKETAYNPVPAPVLSEQPVLKSPPVPVNAVEQKNNLDEFNSRLAKIQLEKKNLAAVLSLLEKIKSPEFKVKTLVDFAEYVSRDSSYKKEADTLYELAAAGIDALAAGKPVIVKLDSVKPDTIKLPEKSVIKTESKIEPEKAEPAKTEPKQKISLIDEQVPTLAPKKETIPEANQEVKTEVKPAAPKKALTLVDEPEEPLPKPEEKPAEVKPEGRKKLMLIDETDEPQPKLAPKPQEIKPQEKPSLEPADIKPAENKPAEVKNSETKPAEESKQTEAAPDADAPVRKPLPPKRKIVLTD